MIAKVLRMLRRRLRPRRRAARPSGAGQGIAKSIGVIDKPSTPAEGPSLWSLLETYIPNDHALQVNARYYLDKVMSGPDAPRHVLDLGCGNGNSVDAFRGHDASIAWVGVDIGDSQEVRARRRKDATFVTYDGTRVPFPDGTFDLVYSSQVLEHVPDPLVHLREIARVLRPGGMFIGSTSQLEPYHSMSYWNITPFGFVTLVRAAGLQVLELRPGIDGVTLTLRSYFGRPSGFDVWWNGESPLNAEIDAWGRETGRRPALINLRKLHMCGQFAFLVTRKAAADA
ncbi:MAG TPA: methyltransferase domain-containing protein [Candidatus Limnocylindrales bacterium]|nr:methyltransferase domain-containing protein [Candidatus Limnocylindrales bacterium]